MWNKIYRWLFGEKKQSNVIFTNSEDGCGISWEDAKEDAENGWKVRYHFWPPDDYVAMDKNLKYLMRYVAKENAFYLFAKEDSDKLIGMAWERCGRANEGSE
ncbi:MAG TPA: hypothetical protein VMZ04_02245 [Anaerolineae bacterium]|nr:hypothetical protein [Anaerolineae bacterium]